MKVKNNRFETVKFGDLCNGDTFIFNGDVYLVLPADVYFEGGRYNCYNLSSEYLGHVDIHVSVEKVEAKIVIN